MANGPYEVAAVLKVVTEDLNCPLLQAQTPLGEELHLPCTTPAARYQNEQ